MPKSLELSEDYFDSSSDIEYFSSEKLIKKNLSKYKPKEEEEKKDDDYDSDCILNNKSNNNSSNSLINENENSKVVKIYSELNDIHLKLVNEYKIFKEKEKELLKREQILLKKESNYYLEELKQKYDKEIDLIREEIKKKLSENKRLSESFRLCKESNENLKKELNETKDKFVNLEKQNLALKSRVANLQQIIENEKKNCQEFSTQEDSKLIETKASSKKLTNNTNSSTNIFDSFSITIEWLNQTVLKQSLNFNLPFKNESNFLIEKACKILPNLSDMFINQNFLIKKNLDLYLEFIYYCLLHFDLSFNQASTQKVNLNSTFRRIGEEVFKLMFQKKDLNSKMSLLACFIVLRTLSQSDHLCKVFDLLRQELKEDELKEEFLNYYGTWTILKWCKLGNQIVLNHCVDIYLLLSIEWSKVDRFLDSCSNESWFSQISILFRNSNVAKTTSLELVGNSLDIKIIEKMSILLQKLSKLKANKKYFEMFSLNKICYDLLKRFAHDSDFLTMNLKSILFNLNDSDSFK